MVGDLTRLLSRGNKLSQFLVLLSFLITFVITRIITTLQHLGILPTQMTPFHIHHLVPGILLLLLSGYTCISFMENKRLQIIDAIIFGVGAALTIDEFALWLFLKDVYWENEGRISVDAVVITIVIFTLVYVISKADNHRWIKKQFKNKLS